jgi:hypothetical protein
LNTGAKILALFTVCIVLVACGAASPSEPTAPEAPPTEAAPTDTVPTPEPTATTEATPTTESAAVAADVTGVEVSGEPGAYQFSVTVASPDTGCDQYADWWEVLSEDGDLLYRRILAHSHVDEQPFTRSGGPVEVPSDATVWVRAHMNTSGYGGQMMRGSVQGGFEQVAPDAALAPNVADEPPQPQGCAF